MNEHEMTKEEAIVALARLANATDDAETLRALLLGCKALARDGIHRSRRHASQIRRRAEARRAAEAEAGKEAGLVDAMWCVPVEARRAAAEAEAGKETEDKK